MKGPYLKIALVTSFFAFLFLIYCFTKNPNYDFVMAIGTLSSALGTSWAVCFSLYSLSVESQEIKLLKKSHTGKFIIDARNLLVYFKKYDNLFSFSGDFQNSFQELLTYMQLYFAEYCQGLVPIKIMEESNRGIFFIECEKFFKSFLNLFLRDLVSKWYYFPEETIQLINQFIFILKDKIEEPLANQEEIVKYMSERKEFKDYASRYKQLEEQLIQIRERYFNF